MIHKSSLNTIDLSELRLSRNKFVDGQLDGQADRQGDYYREPTFQAVP